jgi:hypothetical protein
MTTEREKERKRREAAYRAARKSARGAVRLAGLPQRPPTEHDRPRLSTKAHNVIPGQTSIYGEEVDDAA